MVACLDRREKKRQIIYIDYGVARTIDEKRMVFDEKDDNDAKSRSSASIYHKH